MRAFCKTKKEGWIDVNNTALGAWGEFGEYLLGNALPLGGDEEQS